MGNLEEDSEEMIQDGTQRDKMIENMKVWLWNGRLHTWDAFLNIKQ